MAALSGMEHDAIDEPVNRIESIVASGGEGRVAETVRRATEA